MVANWAFAPVCGVRLLAGHRDLARGPDLPVLHDHGPEDRAGRPGRAGRLRPPRRGREHAPDRAADQRVRDQGRPCSSGLVVVCAARPILDRLLPEPRSAADDLGRLREPADARAAAANGGVVRGALRVGLPVVAVLVLGVGIVVAGTPARGRRRRADTGELLNGVPHQIDPGTLPTITVDVPAWDDSTKAPIAQGILVTLAENLELENQALLRKDGSILTAVDHGDRLKEMQARLQDASATGRRPSSSTTTSTRSTSWSSRRSASRPAASIGFDSTGTAHRGDVRRGGDAARSVRPRRSSGSFAIRRPTGERWMNVGELRPGPAADGRRPTGSIPCLTHTCDDHDT